MRRACRPCRMVQEVFMRACMPRCSQAYLGHQTRAASTKSASPRCSPSPPHRCCRTLASCANRRNAQFLSGSSFSHRVFNRHCTLQVTCLQSRLRMRSAYRAKPTCGASLRARFALICGKANRCHCELPIWRCNTSPCTLIVCR